MDRISKLVDNFHEAINFGETDFPLLRISKVEFENDVAVTVAL